MLHLMYAIRILTTLFLIVVACCSNASDSEAMAWQLRHMEEQYPVRVVAAGAQKTPLKHTDKKLDVQYNYDNSSTTLDEFLLTNEATGFIVVSNGTVLHESYHLGNRQGSRPTSWSIAKSVTATLIGYARADGYIKSLDDDVTRYLPELNGTVYEGVSVREVLQMSSGAAFNEDYDDLQSDFWIFTNHWLKRGEVNEYLVTRTKRDHPPGTAFLYNSSETQVLGWLLERTTGGTVSQYLSEKIWQPMGMESDALWITDKPGGMEVTGFGISARLRDFARFGMLHTDQYAHLLPDGWVTEATTPGASHLEVGALYEGTPLGYGYQWWTFADGGFEAQGIHGQFVYVNPSENLVIAMTSAWKQAWVLEREYEFYAIIQAIRTQLNRE